MLHMLLLLMLRMLLLHMLHMLLFHMLLLHMLLLHMLHMLLLRSDPEWHETLDFHGPLSSFVSAACCVTILDWDLLLFDEPLGEIQISLGLLQEEDQASPRHQACATKPAPPSPRHQARAT